jgi:hypothetical protein
MRPPDDQLGAFGQRHLMKRVKGDEARCPAIAGRHRLASPPQTIVHRDDVMPRDLSTRVSSADDLVQVDQTEDLRDDPRFLEHFPTGSIGHPLSGLHMPTGKTPHARKGSLATFAQEHGPIPENRRTRPETRPVRALFHCDCHASLPQDPRCQSVSPSPSVASRSPIVNPTCKLYDHSPPRSDWLHVLAL